MAELHLALFVQMLGLDLDQPALPVEVAASRGDQLGVEPRRVDRDCGRNRVGCSQLLAFALFLLASQKRSTSPPSPMAYPLARAEARPSKQMHPGARPPRPILRRSAIGSSQVALGSAAEQIVG